jgi:class 3 adenylate cyclase
MRCPHCRHESNEPARFCTWCGAPLAGAVGATAMPRDTRAYTPRHLAEKILTMRSALEGERKHLSILFVDVVDSMRLAEKLDAEEWHRVLERVFEILAAAIHGVEGTINQFTGDGVMALFGAPIAHEDHARRACQAALAAREALRVYAETLRPRGIGLAVRMGINSDEVVVGKIGDDLRMDYTAQGQPVGLAARVQQLAEPGTVLLTENTARLVEGFCILSDAGVRSVKGVSAPIRVLELSAMGPARTRLDAAGRRGLTRLIGRDTELTWLDGILARSIRADGQVVGVVGEAGVGKSRLCLEFARRSRARGVALYEVHCPAHAVTVPRFAIRELLRSFLGLTQTDEVEAMRRRVAEQLRTLDAALADAVPLVLDVLGVGDGAADSPRMTTDLGGFMRHLLRARSAAQPTLVLIDDAHWMDPASHELVCKLAAAARGTRTLLLTNFRPEYRPAWTGGSHYHQLALSPLGAEAARELLDELLGSHGALSGLAASILERTGGNPLARAAPIAWPRRSRRSPFRPPSRRCWPRASTSSARWRSTCYRPRPSSASSSTSRCFARRAASPGLASSMRRSLTWRIWISSDSSRSPRIRRTRSSTRSWPTSPIALSSASAERSSTPRWPRRWKSSTPIDSASMRR